MTTRAQELADRFTQANAKLTALVERSNEGQWRQPCPNEQWSVGVLAHHIAEDHELLAGFVQQLANGEPLPALTQAQVDAMNAERAQQCADCTKEETVELLRRNGATAAATVRGLSDEQLDRTGTFFGQTMSTQQLVEGVLIGHIAEHGRSIQRVIDAQAANAGDASAAGVR